MGEGRGEARRGDRREGGPGLVRRVARAGARSQVAKLAPKTRDQKIEAAGRERWKKANPQLKPEVVPGEHFLLFSTLPRDRAAATVKAMETQYSHLKRLLGSPAADWVEKVSLYVFADRKDFVEFARSVEHREVSERRHGLGQPGGAPALRRGGRPLGGKKEEPPAARRRPCGKKGEEKETAGGSDRTLLGLLTEQLGRLAARRAEQVATLAGSRTSGPFWRPRWSRAAPIIRGCAKPRGRNTTRAGPPRRQKL